MRDCEFHTFLGVKGIVENERSGTIQHLTTVASNATQWGTRLLERTVGQEDQKKLDKIENASKRILRHFLMEAQYPTGGGEVGAYGKGLVFRVDTFMVGTEIFMNEIEVWPPAHDYLDQIVIHNRIFEQLGKYLSGFVSNNFFNWPLWVRHMHIKS